MKQLDHGDPKLMRWIKSGYKSSLDWVLDHPRALLAAGAVSALLAVATVPFFAKTFLPPFNEGSAVVGMRLNPGTTLAETIQLARQAEVLLKQVAEVEHVGRRSGRAELDEHAEGVHVSELDVALRRSERSTAEIFADMRESAVPTAGGTQHRPADLPSHRPHAVRCAFADRDQDLRR